MKIRLGRSLEGSFAARARGRAVVIDSFRSRCCGSATWVGDITARFADHRSADGSVEAEPLEGVTVLVRANLTLLLERGGPSLHGAGMLRRDGLRIELDRPELWLDWLARPGT